MPHRSVSRGRCFALAAVLVIGFGLGSQPPTAQQVPSGQPLFPHNEAWAGTRRPKI
jgi:hypothetical protein